MLIGFGINTHNKTSFKRVADDKDFKHPQHNQSSSESKRK